MRRWRCPISDIPDDHKLPNNVPHWVSTVFTRLWSGVTGTRLGFFGFLLIVYVLPYGLMLAALGTQITSRGDFALIALAGMVAATFASAQPAPTPLMGTASLVLVGLLGSSFEPLLVGVSAGVVATLGLITSFGVGATGVGALLVKRMDGRPGITRLIDRAFSVIRRRGAWGILALSFIPSAIYAWSSVAAGASRMPFGAYVTAAATGSIARFVLVAAIGAGIERIIG